MVAFKLEIQREHDRLTAALVNGDERIPATDVSLAGNQLKVRFNFYDAELIATLEGDDLRGAFSRQWHKQTLTRELTAKRQAMVVSTASTASAAGISGDWIMKVGEGQNQRFWRAAFHQTGTNVSGTIIPVTGDWGQMWGTIENGELRLNRFDGINSRTFRAKLTADGRLEGIVDLGLRDPIRTVVAERMTAENKQMVASLPDPNSYTRMKNPAEPFAFSFPDLDGKTVASTDPQYKNKVVVVTVTGSWCPNCHDESPVLQEFYDRYKANGLAVVALGFEYTGDKQRDAEQLRIFSKRHGVTYPVLLAGTTEEGDAQRKMPQLANFGAFPTTIYIGRDGLVKHVHAGFEGKATGERFTKLKAEMEGMIKEMLESKDPHREIVE
jgi:thiol-disulfide isomerase/thioredoxin